MKEMNHFYSLKSAVVARKFLKHLKYFYLFTTKIIYVIYLKKKWKPFPSIVHFVIQRTVLIFNKFVIHIQFGI